ncbi:MAG: Brp/Blh family beta-carotene 15,15'-dioxygenase [Bacteroidota bacterium]
MRYILMAVGALMLIFQNRLPVFFSEENQVYIFLAGILVLGIPHGAADLMVASSSRTDERKSFSTFRFLLVYLLRLGLFGLFFWLFPLWGNIIFVLIAAYHFGETDLHRFKTETTIGKLFVISYGLLILGFILLHHFDSLIPLFNLFPSGRDAAELIQWIAQNRYILLGFIVLHFFIITFIYFYKHEINTHDSGVFLVHLAIILPILYFLPMMMAFTFYFIIWHSLLSLQNILRYLQSQNKFNNKQIAGQILFYSLLALMGIGLAGAAGFMFINHHTMLVYVFIGLAVLTAPHMQVMHDMYLRFRTGR